MASAMEKCVWYLWQAVKYDHNEIDAMITTGVQLHSLEKEIWRKFCLPNSSVGKFSVILTAIWNLVVHAVVSDHQWEYKHPVVSPIFPRFGW